MALRQGTMMMRHARTRQHASRHLRAEKNTPPVTTARAPAGHEYAAAARCRWAFRHAAPVMRMSKGDAGKITPRCDAGGHEMTAAVTQDWRFSDFDDGKMLQSWRDA